MASSNIKIMYFDVTGRAEIIRLVLAAAGKKYEDVRFDEEEWKTIKPTTPFGHAPCMVLDGKMYDQSWAIATFLAREFGFYGKTNLDGLKIQQVCNLVEDFIQGFINAFTAPGEAKKAELQKKLKEEDAPRFLVFFEKVLKENKTGFVVGNSMTLADMAIFDVVTGYLKSYVEPSLDKFPAVKELVGKVGSNDKIKAYIDGRVFKFPY